MGECLSHLVTLIPGIKEELFYPGTGESPATNGMLWSKIKVLVNGESIDAEALATKVKAGDEIHIEINTR